MANVEDIEDLWKNEVDEKRIEKNVVKMKKKCCGKKETCCNKKKNPVTEFAEKASEEQNKISNAEDKLLKNIPGTQSVFVKTYGCSHNTSDSEYMMGLLSEYGYKLVEDFNVSDICIINSCTVKNPSQAAFVNYVTKAKETGKKVVVAGCVPQGDRNLKGLEECSMIGVTQIDRIVEVVEETLKGNNVKLLAKKELPSLDLPKIRRNELIEIVPINTGCLGSCTYCKTKHARGKLGSYTVEAIVNSCVKAVKDGVKEIWLTSEDTGAYGRDINTDLPTLVMEIIKNIPEHVMIRIGMTNPPYIMEHMDKIVKILNHPNVYSFLHIPVQSGCNEVLDKMNREYKVEDFNYVCDYLIKNVANVTLATDIICGFPYETKENFDETLSLVEKYKFPVINISQFYSRPGTVAAKWKKVDSKEVKKRSTAIAKLFTSYPNYTHLKGTIQRVWIHDTKDEGRSVDENVMIAHTKSYAKVLIKRAPELVGKQVIVKITDIHKWHCYGEIVDSNPKPIHVNFNDHFKGMYNTGNSNKINKMTENRKEQEDIHATFNLVVKQEEVINKPVSIESSPIGKFEIISVILYALSIYFLYLGMKNIIFY